MKSPLMKICYLLLLTSLTTFFGCMAGPDYSRPETAATEPTAYFRAGKNIQDTNDFSIIDNWWQRFGDPLTSDLVRQALKNNQDIKAAAARVLQAKAALEQSTGKQLPQIDYNISRDRSKRSFNFGANRTSALTTTYTQGFSVSYILDFFGKLRRAERAALNDMLASQAGEKALINSIVATVITSRIQIATLQRRLAIAQANTKSRRKTLEIVERRYSQGLVGPVDVRLARENLAAAKTVEPGMRLSVAQAHTALDVLLGQRAGSAEYLPETLADLPNLEPVPVGLPGALLDRRPDVAAAEMSLKAANERIGVSVALLYPDLNIVGNYGGSADKFEDAFKHFSETYSLLLNASQPIFRGGQLRAGVDASKARCQELAANYAQTVLRAIKEVEDALVGEELLREQLFYNQRAFNEAREAERLSGERYQRGVESILTVLESERRRRIAEETLAILKGRIWTTRVNLFLALGGDWTYKESVKVKS